MIIRRGLRLLGISLLMGAGGGCGAQPDAESIGRSEAALGGSGTYLYLLCNTTSFNPNDLSRLVETAPGSGLFNVSYEVAQDWMVTGTGADSCSLVETNQRNGWGTTQTRYAFRSGQSTLINVPDSRALAVASSSSFQVHYPYKARFTATVNGISGTLSISSTVLPQRSLIERNANALGQFSVAQTFTRIASNGGVSGGTAWHDALFRATSTCASSPPTRLNGYIIACPGVESPLVGRLNDWRPLSVTNRFDLAPEGGENCGEARASFFLPPTTPVTDPTRSFMIFEAVIPNPHPELGLDGCRAVQKFWANLSIIADAATRGAKLAEAFYTGEASLTQAGFKPFFSFDNFGSSKGRVRTEVFGGRGIWSFREFRLLTGGAVAAMPVAQDLTSMTVNDEPNGAVNPNAQACRDAVVASLGTFMPANFNSMGLNVAKACFDGTNGNGTKRIEDSITGTPFGDALLARARVLVPGTTLTTSQIAARIQFAGTCVGCHHRPDTTESRDLGQGLTLPVVTQQSGESLDDISFTHVNNLRTEPCAADGADASQTCFKLSPVLGGIFVPHRKNVLENYLRAPVGTYHPPAAGTTSTLTIGGTPNAPGN